MNLYFAKYHKTYKNLIDKCVGFNCKNSMFMIK